MLTRTVVNVFSFFSAPYLIAQDRLYFINMPSLSKLLTTVGTTSPVFIENNARSFLVAILSCIDIDVNNKPKKQLRSKT
jgi:hypothetical protein